MVLVPVGIIIATAVSFVVNVFLLRIGAEKVEEDVEAEQEAKLEPTPAVVGV